MKMCLRKGLAGVWYLLAFSMFTVAQYRVDAWTTDEGLPQNSVNEVIQARDGYIWGVTRGGIIRFDGVRFKVFSRSNTPALKESRFLRVVEDKAGRLWFLSESWAIIKYENGAFTTFTAGQGFTGKFRGLFLLTDSDGNLMFSTDKGHWRYQDGGFVRFDVPTSNAASTLCYRDRQGGIWLSDQTGLRRVFGGQAQYYPFANQFPQNIPIVYDDRHGNFWVSFGPGIYRIHQGTISARPVAPRLLTRGWAFAEDLAGNLWLGHRHGLYKIEAGAVNTEVIDPAQLTDIPLDNGGDEVASLTPDREGGIWAGMFSRGLVHITRQAVQVFAKPAWQTANDNVYPMLEDQAGQVWVGTWSGALIKYNQNNAFKVYHRPPGEEQITSLWEDSRRRLWIGFVNGVSYWENEKFSRFLHFSDDTENGIFVAIGEDNTGNLWFATERGLYRYDGQQVTHFTTADGLPDNDITAFLKTKTGQFWIGTRRGLALSEAEKFTAVTRQDDLDGDHIRSLYEDAQGVIWLGTYDAGLLRYKDGKFKRIAQQDGMFNSNVFCTLEDDNGWFWINSNNGIYRVRKQELNDFADGKIARVESIGYNKKDGLLNIEGNGGKQPAGLRRSNGELWFPTQQGVAVIKPNEITLNPQPPPVHVEEVFVDKTEVASGNGYIEMPAGGNNLEINYTGLSFLNSLLVKFRYRLEGLETNWNEAGTRRVAFYNNLPPGAYTFRVLAANRDGVWNTQGAALKIVKRPRFYQTWWFTGLAILGAAGLVALFFYNRVARLRSIAQAKTLYSRRLIEAQEAERKRLATELHDGLGQSLAIISNRAALGQSKKHEPEAVAHELTEISHNAWEALDEVHEIINKLHPHYLERLGLTKALQAMFMKLPAGTEFVCEIDAIDHIFPKEAEINVYRIVQEAVNNIIKHAGATAAGISVEKNAGEVVIVVKDDGKGFDAGNIKATGGGLGLVSLRERTNMLGGSITISSSLGKGTEIKVMLPLKLKESSV